MNSVTLLIPLGLSAIAGALIGYANQRATDIGEPRTFVLVCCGSTLITLVSRYFFIGLDMPRFADPGRISAQIIPAIFFLVFGMLWFTDTRSSQGISVATNLWITALVGMILGAGIGWHAMTAFGFVILVYFLLHEIEARIKNR